MLYQFFKWLSEEGFRFPGSNLLVYHLPGVAGAHFKPGDYNAVR